MIDLNDLDKQRQRWISLGGPLKGVDILVKHASPKEAERFRQRCARLGILKSARDEGWNINTGRETDFFEEFATFYVLDWRDTPGIKDPPAKTGGEYSAQKMGIVLGASQSAFELVSKVIIDDAGFFETSAGG